MNAQVKELPFTDFKVRDMGLAELGRKRGVSICFPRHEFCTDNGAMIAFAGYLRLQAGQSDSMSISARPRWDMASLPAIG